MYRVFVVLALALSASTFADLHSDFRLEAQAPRLPRGRQQWPVRSSTL
jgi:hypothetical protein